MVNISKKDRDLTIAVNEKLGQTRFDSYVNFMFVNTQESIAENQQKIDATTERTQLAITIIDKIRRSHNIQTIFTTTTQEMRRVLKSDRLIVYQFNSDWSGQVVAESVGSGWISLLIDQSYNELSDNGHIKRDRCLLRDWSRGDIVRQDSFLQQTQGGKYTMGQKFTAVDNIYNRGFPDCYVKSLEAYQAKAYLLAPIFQNKQLWGLLGAYQNDSTRVWQNTEIELTIQIASQLGVALQQAEYVNQLKLQKRDLEITLEELNLAQQQLIQQEKLAALGQLVAGVAHEINTPLGAIQASANNNSKALTTVVSELPHLSQRLNPEQKDTFFQLLLQAMKTKPIYSSSEKRPLKRQIASQLKEQDVANGRNIADLLIDIGITSNIESYISLLKSSRVDWTLDLAYNLTRLLGNNRTILTSVDKASKVVFALKNYARFNSSGEKQLAKIQDGVETVLEIYHNQIKHNVELVRNYQDVPEILCYPDELIQVWTNLIHNAIQAMNQAGKLTISIGHKNDGVEVEIADTGTGIPDQIKEKIFEAFFTTKPLGEGSGLGLYISKKIIDKHDGKIAVASEPGHTKFSVWLPFNS